LSNSILIQDANLVLFVETLLKKISKRENPKEIVNSRDICREYMMFGHLANGSNIAMAAGALINKT
jgi:hypothetical protein